MPKQPFLEIGEIVGTHGVRGEVRVNPWCDAPAQLTPVKTLYWDADGTRAVKVACRPHKNVALVTLSGVTDVNAAAALRGRVLYAARGDLRLPEDRHFVADLIGMAVVDADSGERYGTLTDVSYTGANDVYHMADTAGREVLIPVIPDVVIAVDEDTDTVKIRPIKGLLNDED